MVSDTLPLHHTSLSQNLNKPILETDVSNRLVVNSVDSDQAPLVASDLGPQCLLMQACLAKNLGQIQQCRRSMVSIKRYSEDNFSYSCFIYMYILLILTGIASESINRMCFGLKITKTILIKKTCLFNYIESFTSKNWKISDKNSDIFHITAQNIDCGYLLELPRQSGSNEYPQSMFLSRNKKNNVYPWKLQFYNIKVGFKGVKSISACFVM